MVMNLLEQERDHTQEEVVMSIFDIICRLSPETAYHCMRVSEYSEILAMGIGMSEDEAKRLGQAALLHDLGKIVIPADIIEKPGKLTQEEYEVVKRHVVHGYDFLSGATGETLRLAARIALEHHERWDGSGYLRERGHSICPEARIVSVADVFDALISERCYKKVWAPDKAKDEIIRNGGTQFAPDVAKVFQRIFCEVA